MASTTTVKHPAKFSEPIINRIGELADEFMPPRERWQIWLDPFGGVGRAQQLTDQAKKRTVVICEIEPEWAAQAPDQDLVAVEDCLIYMARAASRGYTFAGIVTSPCYGNRMADHHEAKDASVRHTYRHYLGRRLWPNSSAGLQWGAGYRLFHQEAWQLAFQVVEPGGVLILNISDHYRKGLPQGVPTWHRQTLEDIGFKLVRAEAITTRRLKHGRNAHDVKDAEGNDRKHNRMRGELIYVFRKPA